MVENTYFSSFLPFRLTSAYVFSLGEIIACLFILGIIVGFTLGNKRVKVLVLASLSVVIPLSILDTRFSEALRYVTFVIPLILAVSLYPLFSVIRIGQKTIRIIVVALLIFIMLTLVVPFIVNTDEHFRVKQDFTWARPDYRVWSEIEVPKDCIIVTNVPHITKHYVGNVHYKLDITDANEFDDLTGVPVIHDVSFLQEACVVIFADYRRSYMWDKATLEYVLGNYVVLQRGRQVECYIHEN